LRGNRQTITGSDQAVELFDVCGAVVSGNDFGTGQVQTKGNACAARLVVPQPPVIPGRSAAANPGIVRPTHSGTASWVWVVVAIGAVALVLAIVLLVRRRRKRRPPPEPTEPQEPTEPVEPATGPDLEASFGPPS
jgi:hypothetical protein